MNATSAPQSRRRGRPPKGTRGDTRQELLDAALRLFARQGYAATTVRQIADEVGVRDSAIYVHFEAKQELLDALVAESGPQLIDRLGLDVIRLSDRPPGDALPPILDRILEAWDTPRQRELMSLLIREGLAGMREVLGSLSERLEPHVRRWAADGELRGDVAPELLLWELTAPLAAVRMLHLNARARPAERREGRSRAREHITYFLDTAAA